MESLHDINMNGNELQNARVKIIGTIGNITSINSSGILSDSSVAVTDVQENIVTSSEFTSLYTKLGIT